MSEFNLQEWMDTNYHAFECTEDQIECLREMTDQFIEYAKKIGVPAVVTFVSMMSQENHRVMGRNNFPKELGKIPVEMLVVVDIMSKGMTEAAPTIEAVYEAHCEREERLNGVKH